MAGLDPDVLTLIRGGIRSTWSLDLLLQLRQIAPEARTSAQLVLQLRANDKLIATCLEQLERMALSLLMAPADLSARQRRRPWTSCALLWRTLTTSAPSRTSTRSFPDNARSSRISPTLSVLRGSRTNDAASFSLSALLSASGLCAMLLVRAYRRKRTRFLWWSAISFVFLTINNCFVVADLVWFPAVDLLLFRHAAALGAVASLLYGFIWEAE